MMKKWIALALVLCLLLSLAACGDKEQDRDEAGGGQQGAAGVDLEADILMGTDSGVTLGTPEKALDPEQIYANLTYTPEMFCGNYRMLGGDTAAKEAAKTLSTFELTRDGETKEYPILPYRIETGDDTLNHWVTRIKGYNWCRVYFMRPYGEGDYILDYFFCAYTVEGDKLTLNPIDHFEVDAENNHITYAMTEVFLTYEFSFRGRTLTLSRDGKSVTMHTGLNSSDDTPFISIEAYLSGDRSLDGMKELLFGYYGQGSDVVRVHLLGEDFSSSDACGKMEANGLLTFSVLFGEEVKTYQFVYFYCGADGLVLTDGTDTYYYNHSWYTYLKGDLSANVTDENAGKLEELPQDKLEDIVEKKDNLMEDLTVAFANAGIAVTVNAATGELALDASILFGGDSSELTDAGKEFLDKFVAVYASIIGNEKYAGFVEKTLVEGHTAKLADSTFESGLPLSQERADKVKEYCANAQSSLADSLEAVGMSCSKPIYNEDGSVNLQASRRVSFKFIINLEQ